MFFGGCTIFKEMFNVHCGFKINKMGWREKILLEIILIYDVMRVSWLDPICDFNFIQVDNYQSLFVTVYDVWRAGQRCEIHFTLLYFRPCENWQKQDTVEKKTCLVESNISCFSITSLNYWGRGDVIIIYFKQTRSLTKNLRFQHFYNA